MPLVVTDSQHYTDIANSLRANLPSEDTFMPADMAAAVSEVRTNTKNEGDLNLWNVVTAKGQRQHYTRAFYSTDYSGFSFPKPVTVTGRITYMFYDYRGKYLPGNIDLSQAKVDETGAEYGMSYTFGWGGYNWIFSIYDMGWPAPAEYRNTFAYSRALHTIERLPVKKSTKFVTPFTECFGLKNITVDGEIGNSVSFSSCTNLTHDSLMSIIDALYDYAAEGSTATYTLTIGETNIAKLTEAEQKIVTDKGWTLA